MLAVSLNNQKLLMNTDKSVSSGHTSQAITYAFIYT